MHHYTTCGLDNVWLANGYRTHDTPYGSGVSIADADGLHKLLAVEVAKKNGPLTRKEFRFLRTMLCLSQKNLAEMVGVTEQAVSLWERYGKVPKIQDAVLRTLILDAFDGHGTMKQAIDRLNIVERLVNQKIVAKARQHVWTAKIQVMSPDEALAA
jgi:DNA-binding transcriptional regulator YiaG